MTLPTLAVVRDAVLAVHRALLETERLAWERMNGRVAGNLEVLRLAIEDPWFAWLRPLTALIAAMDEALQDQTPEGEARLAEGGAWGLLHLLGPLRLRERDGGKRMLVDLRSGGARLFLEIGFAQEANAVSVRGVMKGFAGTPVL